METATPARAPRRPEISGLRGLAIALVVVYHLWGAGRVSGGVDVFLMISAYLMTLSFVRKGTAFRFFDFLVGRFRRLVPQAALTILMTLLGIYFFLPPARWFPLLDQAQSSLFYVQNWKLIELATNYTAAERNGVSPLQHFWSLSIQGQIFVLWPILMMVAIGLFLAVKIPIRVSLAVIFVVIAVDSFWYAYQGIQTQPAAIYFDTRARAWEFALASLLALIPHPRLPRPLAAVLSWVGVIAIAVAGIVIGREPFPGPVALWPSLAAAAVVFGASPDSRFNAGHWLSTRAFAWLGERAYGLYLWHWPLFMFYLAETGQDQPGVFGGLLIIAASLAMADLTTRTVERRFNRMRRLSGKRWGLAITATITIIAVGVIDGWGKALTRDVEQVNAAPVEQHPGARALTPGAVPPTPTDRGIAPGDTVIGTDWPEPLPPCSANLDPMPPPSECGEIVPPGEPHKTVVMMGDSHTNQWSGRMAELAQRENWHLIVAIRPNCRVSLPNPLSDEGCVEYSRGMVDYILKLQPDFVFTVGSRGTADGFDLPIETYPEAVRPLTDAGIQIVNIRDNPRFSYKMPECIQRYGVDSPRCVQPRDAKLNPNSPMNELESIPGMHTMDLSAYFCPDETCPGVIGNVYVYMDDNHLSRTYVSSLKEEFEAQLWLGVER